MDLQRSAVQGTPTLHMSVVFLGAPHRGMNVTALEMLVRGKVTERLIQDLKKGSTLLTYLNETFPLVSENVKIITCFELRTTPTSLITPRGNWERTGPAEMMVDRDSACLYTENEDRIAIDENHSMTAKMSDQARRCYHAVKDRLSSHIRDAPAIVKARIIREESATILNNVLGLIHSVQQATPEPEIPGMKSQRKVGATEESINDLISVDILSIHHIQKSINEGKMARILIRADPKNRCLHTIFDGAQILFRIFSVYQSVALLQSPGISSTREEVKPNARLYSINEDGPTPLSADMVQKDKIFKLLRDSKRCITQIREAILAAVLGTEKYYEFGYCEAPPYRNTELCEMFQCGNTVNKRSSGVLEGTYMVIGQLQESEIKSDLPIMSYASSDSSQERIVMVDYRSFAAVDADMS
jgi:hypothetical protein